MAAPVSVMLAADAPSAALGPALGALAEGAVTGLVRELIIRSDAWPGGGAPEQDPLAEIAEAVGARRAFGSERAVAADCRGDWVLFWSDRATPPPGWPAVAAAHMAERPSAAACFGLEGPGRGVGGRLEAAWTDMATRLLGRRAPEQGLLAPRPAAAAGALGRPVLLPARARAAGGR